MGFFSDGNNIPACSSNNFLFQTIVCIHLATDVLFLVTDLCDYFGNLAIVIIAKSGTRIMVECQQDAGRK